VSYQERNWLDIEEKFLEFLEKGITIEVIGKESMIEKIDVIDKTVNSVGWF